jgi:SAM-dependent methyltransferase
LQLYVIEVLLYVFVSGLDGAGRENVPDGHGATGVSLDKPGRHRAGATAVADISARDGSGLFTLAALGYAVQRPGHSLALLQAGCTTAGDDPDIGRLRSCGCEVTVSLIDDDNPAARDAVAADPGLGGCTLADLRVVPLAPRSFDIVHCTLLERIANAELVLDRLVETLRPGGLLLVSTGDRESAAGFLDRVLPRPLRALTGPGRRPGQPRLYPGVYEPLASGRGIQSFAQRRGLVISQRETRSQAARRPGLPARVPAAQRLVSQLSMGRLSCAHDELCYVIRKPEPGFARVL